MEKKFRILCFGDSNTFGYIPGRGGRYDRHTRWPGRLQELLGSEYQVIEEGLCGAGQERPGPDPGSGGAKPAAGSSDHHAGEQRLQGAVRGIGSGDCGRTPAGDGKGERGRSSRLPRSSGRSCSHDGTNYAQRLWSGIRSAVDRGIKGAGGSVRIAGQKVRMRFSGRDEGDAGQ